MDTGGFIDYRSAHEYAQGIKDAINSVEELLKKGHSAEVIELTEHALAAVEDAMGSIDDSDGCMGGILERLQEIHHAACKKTKPDPEALARRLFEWELRTDWAKILLEKKMRGTPNNSSLQALTRRPLLTIIPIRPRPCYGMGCETAFGRSPLFLGVLR